MQDNFHAKTPQQCNIMPWTLGGVSTQKITIKRELWLTHFKWFSLCFDPLLFRKQKISLSTNLALEMVFFLILGTLTYFSTISEFGLHSTILGFPYSE